MPSSRASALHVSNLSASASAARSLGFAPPLPSQADARSSRTVVTYGMYAESTIDASVGMADRAADRARGPAADGSAARRLLGPDRSPGELDHRLEPLVVELAAADV